MKYVYSLDDDQYFECSNILNVRKIINIALEENNIEDYVEDGFFQLYIAEKEDFEPSISIATSYSLSFLSNIGFNKKYNGIPTIKTHITTIIVNWVLFIKSSEP